MLALMCWTSAPAQPSYRGVLNYNNVYVNHHLYVDSDGNMMLGETFPECEWRFHIDPRGIIFLGFDNDYLINQSFKWYKIEDEELIESSDLLPILDNHSYPVIWTPKPFRVIIGSNPTHVWDLDPETLEATLVSTFSDPEWGGYDATLVDDLNFIYLNPNAFFILRANYDDETGI